WQANENSDGVVEYGLSQNNLVNSAIEIPRASLKTNHQVTVSRLFPFTTYYYKLTSADKSYNISAPLIGSFTTGLTNDDGTFTSGETNESLDALSEADAESVYLASLQRATDIIRSMSSQVSLGILESTLLEQNTMISELSRILPTPVISGEAVVEAGSTYVTISWLTDKISNSLIDIGA
ncbi:MAG: hypothetical protein COU34_03085, partial [Candidatus Magasanikbacteria bacterium CG10_big_fil_rev_8_21_14_0_10_43_9]